MLNNIGSSIARFTGRTGLKIRKFSPEILIGAGIVGMVTGTVMACRATASDKYLDVMCDFYEAKKGIEQATEIAEQNPTKVVDGKEVETYSARDRKMDVISNYRKTTWALTKLYSPSVLVMGLGIVSILGGFSIIKKRNVGLMAAYAVVDKAFKDYRGRVSEELGEDKDKHFLYGTDEIISTKKVINEDGSVEKIKETQQILKGIPVSMYARIFGNNPEDRTSYTTQFTNLPNFNWLFIKKKLDWLNDKLNAQGHVFLNEVYDELGFDRTREGSVVGWIKRGPDAHDSYIDFGPWWQSLTAVEEMGPGAGILLDFNVDGVIWDKI